MPLQQTSGAASYDAFGGGVPVAAKYIEDFFQTWLRTGTGASATVTTGLNGAINETMVWTKSRSAATNHKLTDNVRGATKALSSNTTAAEVTDSQGLTAFSSTGYTIGTNTDYNNSGATYVDWQWVATPKFFDVVTYTTVSGAMTIPHNLGSTPGCWIIKATNADDSWWVFHRSIPGELLRLNGTSAVLSGFSTATSTNISISNGVFSPGTQIVIYLFAHNAGGFGLTGTDNVISCGSYNGATTSVSVNLGWEPQFVLIKKTNSTGPWVMSDVMRGMNYTSDNLLYSNTSIAEEAKAYQHISPTPTGFDVAYANADTTGSGSTFIYIAIRRGPMKVPTSGTSVFSPNAVNVSDGTQVTTGFPVDMTMPVYRAGGGPFVEDRLIGVITTPTVTASEPFLRTPYTDAEGVNIGWTKGWNNQGFLMSNSFAGADDVFWSFRRAPSFFDVVCYTGTGSATTQKHNLGVVPELVIYKTRNTTQNWTVYLNYDYEMYLNLTAALQGPGYSGNHGAPTSTTISVDGNSNTSGNTYVAYLFATCPAVSKVFSYTGNGSSQTINCGFTGGARWILIKRTDSTGDWYVWDSARGIVSGNDPHLSLNTTAAEVTTDDTIDTDSTGFVVNQVSATNVNVSSATYIGIAIA